MRDSWNQKIARLLEGFDKFQHEQEKYSRFKRAYRANPPKVDIRFIPNE